MIGALAMVAGLNVAAFVLVGVRGSGWDFTLLTNAVFIGIIASQQWMLRRQGEWLRDAYRRIGELLDVVFPGWRVRFREHQERDR